MSHRKPRPVTHVVGRCSVRRDRCPAAVWTALCLQLGLNPKGHSVVDMIEGSPAHLWLLDQLIINQAIDN